ncbi:MAG TPA: peptidoglycan DD-metalloendopeptidase family protein [Pseudolabrys sp.]|nr:peptidoglycan DD-metalloendopeptidase family protein [Pseudolabrys sp.]
MLRSKVEIRLRVWPRVAVLALVGTAAAGCSDSARFTSSSYDTDRPAPPQNLASSVSAPPASARIEAQSLPAVTQPGSAMPAAYAAPYPATYRPSGQNSDDITGSAVRAPSGHWTWDGGSAVTVGYGETIDTIARRHNVPAAALMQTNGIRDASQIRPGQRLVIPRYGSTSTQTAAKRGSTNTPAIGSIHIVKSGDTLMSISRHSGVTVAELARANHLQSSAKLSVGDRLTIPASSHAVAAAPRVAGPQAAQPRAAPMQRVASAAPVQNAQVAKADPQTTETVVKVAEPSGGMPSFRWPVRGRVIAGFGSKPNGAQNDGINLAVPEGTPIKAADDGVVAYAGNELKGYGNLVLIRHSNGFVSAYAHASELMVKRGDAIKRGQVIAHAGQTGNVSSPQLHFEIRKGSTPVDPTQYLGGA